MDRVPSTTSASSLVVAIVDVTSFRLLLILECIGSNVRSNIARCFDVKIFRVKFLSRSSLPFFILWWLVHQIGSRKLRIVLALTLRGALFAICGNRIRMSNLIILMLIGRDFGVGLVQRLRIGAAFWDVHPFVLAVDVPSWSLTVAVRTFSIILLSTWFGVALLAVATLALVALLVSSPLHFSILLPRIVVFVSRLSWNVLAITIWTFFIIVVSRLLVVATASDISLASGSWVGCNTIVTVITVALIISATIIIAWVARVLVLLVSLVIVTLIVVGSTIGLLLLVWPWTLSVCARRRWSLSMLVVILVQGSLWIVQLMVIIVFGMSSVILLIMMLAVSFLVRLLVVVGVGVTLIACCVWVGVSLGCSSRWILWRLVHLIYSRGSALVGRSLILRRRRVVDIVIVIVPTELVVPILIKEVAIWVTEASILID